MQKKKQYLLLGLAVIVGMASVAAIKFLGPSRPTKPQTTTNKEFGTPYLLASLSKDGESWLNSLVAAAELLQKDTTNVSDSPLNGYLYSEFDPAFLRYVLNTVQFLRSFDEFNEYLSARSSADAREILRNRLMSAVEFRASEIVRHLDAYSRQPEDGADVQAWAESKSFSELLRKDEFLSIVEGMNQDGLRETVTCYKFSATYFDRYLLPAIDVLRMSKISSGRLGDAEVLAALAFVKLAADYREIGKEAKNKTSRPETEDEELLSDVEIVHRLLLSDIPADADTQSLSELALNAIQRVPQIASDSRLMRRWLEQSPLVLVRANKLCMVGRLVLSDPQSPDTTLDAKQSLRSLGVQLGAALNKRDGKDHFSEILAQPLAQVEPTEPEVTRVTGVELLGTGLTLTLDSIPLAELFHEDKNTSRTWPTVPPEELLKSKLAIDEQALALALSGASQEVGRQLPWRCFKYVSGERASGNALTISCRLDADLSKFCLNCDKGKVEFSLPVHDLEAIQFIEGVEAANAIIAAAERQQTQGLRLATEKLSESTSNNLRSPPTERLREFLIRNIKLEIASTNPVSTMELGELTQEPQLHVDEIEFFDSGHFAIPNLDAIANPQGVVRFGDVLWYCHKNSRAAKRLRDEFETLVGETGIAPSTFGRLIDAMERTEKVSASDFGVSQTNRDAVAKAVLFRLALSRLERSGIAEVALGKVSSRRDVPHISLHELGDVSQVEDFLEQLLTVEAQQLRDAIDDALVVESVSDPRIVELLVDAIRTPIEQARQRGEIPDPETEEFCEIALKQQSELRVQIRSKVVTSNGIFFLELASGALNGLDKGCLILWRVTPGGDTLRFGNVIWAPEKSRYAFVYPGKTYTERNESLGLDFQLTVEEVIPKPGTLRFRVVTPDSNTGEADDWVSKAVASVASSYQVKWSNDSDSATMSISPSGVSIYDRNGQLYKERVRTAFRKWLEGRDWYVGAEPAYKEKVGSFLANEMQLSVGTNVADLLSASEPALSFSWRNEAVGKFSPISNSVVIGEAEEEVAKTAFMVFLNVVGEAYSDIGSVFPVLSLGTTHSLLAADSQLPVVVQQRDSGAVADAILKLLRNTKQVSEAEIERLRSTHAGNPSSVLTELSERGFLKEENAFWKHWISARPAGSTHIAAKWLEETTGIRATSDRIAVNVRPIVQQGPYAETVRESDGTWTARIGLPLEGGEQVATLSGIRIGEKEIVVDNEWSMRDGNLLAQYLQSWLGIRQLSTVKNGTRLEVLQSKPPNVSDGSQPKYFCQFALILEGSQAIEVGFEDAIERQLATLDVFVSAYDNKLIVDMSIVSTAEANSLLALANSVGREALDEWRHQTLAVETVDAFPDGPSNSTLRLEFRPFESREHAIPRIQEQLFRIHQTTFVESLSEAVRRKWGAAVMVSADTAKSRVSLTFPLAIDSSRQSQNLDSGLSPPRLKFVSNRGLSSARGSEWIVEDVSSLIPHIQKQAEMLGLAIDQGFSTPTFAWDNSDVFSANVVVNGESIRVIARDDARIVIQPQNQQLLQTALQRLVRENLPLLNEWKASFRNSIERLSIGRLDFDFVFEEVDVEGSFARIACTAFTNGVATSSRRFDVSLLDPWIDLSAVERFARNALPEIQPPSKKEANLPLGIRAEIVPDDTTDVADDWRIDVIFPEP
ncbi:hypothetical protein, partial [Rhodopirellula sallentina]